MHLICECAIAVLVLAIIGVAYAFWIAAGDEVEVTVSKKLRRH